MEMIHEWTLDLEQKTALLLSQLTENQLQMQVTLVTPQKRESCFMSNL